MCNRKGRRGNRRLLHKTLWPKVKFVSSPRMCPPLILISDDSEWTGSLRCLLPHHRTRMKTQGTFGCTFLHKSVANPGVNISVSMLGRPDKSLLPRSCASPGCIMFLWQTVWLRLKRRRKTQSGQDRGAGAPEGCRAEWGSPASSRQGFPHSHLACVNSRLAQAHSSTLTSALPQCPHSTSCSMAQTMNKRPCLRTAAHTAEGRHFLETVTNNSAGPESRQRETGHVCPDENKRRRCTERAHLQSQTGFCLQ